MDRNAPDGLRDTPQASYDDTNALIARWHGKGRLHYAVSPRFAITSSPEQMEMAGALMRQHPGLHMQDASVGEPRRDRPGLQPLSGSRDYADIYARYGLLGDKALLGHCIHLSEREADALSDSGSVAVFCPTRPLPRLWPVRLAALPQARQTSARGGRDRCRRRGTNYSMLRTMDEGLQGDRAARRKDRPALPPFWQITRGNAEAHVARRPYRHAGGGHERRISSLLNSAATPNMALRMERVETLAEELFMLQTLGERPRGVVET